MSTRNRFRSLFLRYRLQDAAWMRYMGDPHGAQELITEIVQTLVPVESELNNGKRKSSSENDEQEKEKAVVSSNKWRDHIRGLPPAINQPASDQPERNEDGYLIR